MQIESFYLQTPIGRLLISCEGTKVIEVNLGMDKKKHRQAQVSGTSGLKSHFAQKVKNQINDYFGGSSTHFDLDLSVQGTDYQKLVWQRISAIKWGETLTYSDIAEQLDSSARAVGNACRANPVPIIVPCHRVVSKSGLGGFAGQREGNNINVKTWLIDHERCLGGISAILNDSSLS